MAISYNQKAGSVTVLGKETEFDGVIEFAGNLIIKGIFNGSIKSEGSLVIEKTGKCVVDTATAESITIAGDITGNLIATDNLEMFSGSHVIGDIEAARLRIEDKVEFTGDVKMREELPDMDVFLVSPKEYRDLVSKRTTKEEE